MVKTSAYRSGYRRGVLTKCALNPYAANAIAFPLSFGNPSVPRDPVTSGISREDQQKSTVVGGAIGLAAGAGLVSGGIPAALAYGSASKSGIDAVSNAAAGDYGGALRDAGHAAVNLGFGGLLKAKALGQGAIQMFKSAPVASAAIAGGSAVGAASNAVGAYENFTNGRPAEGAVDVVNAGLDVATGAMPFLRVPGWVPLGTYIADAAVSPALSDYKASIGLQSDYDRGGQQLLSDIKEVMSGMNRQQQAQYNSLLGMFSGDNAAQSKLNYTYNGLIQKGLTPEQALNALTRRIYRK